MKEKQKNDKLSAMKKEEISKIGKILMEDDLYADIIAYAENSRRLRKRYQEEQAKQEGSN